MLRAGICRRNSVCLSSLCNVHAITNSLAVSTDHWIPPKTAVAQYRRQVPKPPKKPQPATAKKTAQ